jgi:CBS domain-containing protein
MRFYAKDIMNRPVITARPEMTSEQVVELMLANSIGGLPVVDMNGALMGVITLYDVVNAQRNMGFAPTYFEQININSLLEQEGFHMETTSEGFVTDYMTRDVYTVLPETPIEELARLMYLQRIHRVIVLMPNEQIPIGIVTTFDLLKLVAEGQTLCEALTV